MSKLKDELLVRRFGRLTRRIGSEIAGGNDRSDPSGVPDAACGPPLGSDGVAYTLVAAYNMRPVFRPFFAVGLAATGADWPHVVLHGFASKFRNCELKFSATRFIDRGGAV